MSDDDDRDIADKMASLMGAKITQLNCKML